MMSRFMTVLLLPVLVTGCAVQYDTVALQDGQPALKKEAPELQQKITALKTALLALDKAVDPTEAAAVAHDAVVYPLHLANQWELTWPPLYHNTLRNMKVRQKGLCTDWARAMINRMRRKNLQTLDVYWALANEGDYFREHSSLLITARDKPFTSGIIMDPWRNSGRLYWSHLKKDTKYSWAYHAGPYKSLLPAITLPGQTKPAGKLSIRSVRLNPEPGNS